MLGVMPGNESNSSKNARKINETERVGYRREEGRVRKRRERHV